MTKEASCTGKDPLTAVQARAIAKRSKDKKVQPYRCKYCGKWHVGASR